MCAERQWEILQNAYEALRPGGVLIYSTCTFNRSEDEEILQRAMQQWGEELEAVDDIAVDEQWGVVEGREGVFHTYRFFPHKVAGEGMFMAVARKGGSNMARRHTPKSRRQIISKVEKRDVAELSRWVREPEQMQFFVAGEMIYGCRKEHFADIEMLSGVLSVIYSGVAMGQIFKGRLKPDGALAMWVGFRREVVECRSLAQEQVLQFLRKQEVSASLFAEGLNLVEYEGLSLGFVKRIGGRVNNLYSNSLRILK
jgi:NOL1/NOP2/fmu family ribosome biogenesis protein